MAASIVKIEPGRGRAGASISLLGDGFSVTGGQNVVTVGGLPSLVTLNTLTQVDVTVPGGIPLDQHLEVVLTNLDDGTTTTWWWWSKDSVANLATVVLPFKEPGADEFTKGLQNTDMRVAEAKYFERLVDKLELLGSSFVAAKGALAAMSTTGLRGVLPGALGQVLVNAPTGGAFQVRQTWSLHWGRQIPGPTFNPATVLMEAGALDTNATVLATAEVAPVAGRVAVVSVFVRLGTPGTSRVHQVVILVNGAAAHTEDVLPGILTGQSVTFYPWVAVAQGDRVEVQLRKTTAASVINARAVAQLV